MWIKFLYFFLLLLFSAEMSAKASSEIKTDLNKFHHLATSNEFTLTAVTSVAQDEHSVMWFGTREGIMTYDGEEFRKLETINEELIQRNQFDISNLIFDRRGQLWLATTNGIVVIDPRTLKLSSPIPGDSSSMFLNSPANCLYELRSGNILIGLISGLYEYSPFNGTLSLIPNEKYLDKHPSADNIQYK